MYVKRGEDDNSPEPFADSRRRLARLAIVCDYLQPRPWPKGKSPQVEASVPREMTMSVQAAKRRGFVVFKFSAREADCQKSWGIRAQA